MPALRLTAGTWDFRHVPRQMQFVQSYKQISLIGGLLCHVSSRFFLRVFLPRRSLHVNHYANSSLDSPELVFWIDRVVGKCCT
jgi:hypothetical protein